MFHIILYQPEIPPNTGNIIRLAANTGCHLHLIKPLAFDLDDKRLRRAGLDYDEWASVKQYDDLTDCLAQFQDNTVYALTTKGAKHHHEKTYQQGDVFLFGPETRGLPDTVLATFTPEQKIRIPMLAHSRSLNLSNAVAVVVYEAWRQNNFN